MMKNLQHGAPCLPPICASAFLLSGNQCKAFWGKKAVVPAARAIRAIRARAHTHTKKILMNSLHLHKSTMQILVCSEITLHCGAKRADKLQRSRTPIFWTPSTRLHTGQLKSSLGRQMSDLPSALWQQFLTLKEQNLCLH